MKGQINTNTNLYNTTTIIITTIITMIISNRTVTTDPAIAGLGSPTKIIR